MTYPLTKDQRIKVALRANDLTWESPIVDLIDALVYDGDFTREEADEIACRSAR